MIIGNLILTFGLLSGAGGSANERVDKISTGTVVSTNSSCECEFDTGCPYAATGDDQSILLTACTKEPIYWQPYLSGSCKSGGILISNMVCYYIGSFSSIALYNVRCIESIS